jgi:hypothetical protein
MKTISSLLLAVVLCLALSTVAFGQSSVQGYNDVAGQVQSQVGGGGDGTSPSSTSPSSTTPVSQASSGGSLPFTGLDVALLAGAGGLLVAAGFGMRRLTRSSGTA